MRRTTLALALVVGALAVTAQQASTASNAVPPSTATQRATTVNGATLVSLDYTVTGSQITGLTARLQAIGLTTKTLTARFGSDASVLCTAGLPTVIDLTLDLTQADYTCLGFSERANRPRPLVLDVS